jgi:SAM-dependent methyltransferase
MVSRKKIESLGWLGDEEKSLEFKELSYPARRTPALWRENIGAIRRFESALESREFTPESLPDIFGGSRGDDLVLSEIDRYGLPVRTVINLSTGLIRTDPFISQKQIALFYSQYYRDIYKWENVTEKDVLAQQISKGRQILNKAFAMLNRTGVVLDIGCGMGGMLVPFKETGWITFGIDYGGEMLQHGRKLGLNLQQCSPAEFNESHEVDLIILSHVLEHQREPKAFLREILAKWPRATVYIEVPGVHTISTQYSSDLLLYLQNAHTFHFTRESLQFLLAELGYRSSDCDDSVAGFFKKQDDAEVVMTGALNSQGILDFLHNQRKKDDHVSLYNVPLIGKRLLSLLRVR